MSTPKRNLLSCNTSADGAKQIGGWNLFKNPDGTDRVVAGVRVIDWGWILGLLVLLYTFLGFFYAGLLNIAIEIRKEDWLLLADDHYGPFERADRYLYVRGTDEKLPALEMDEDITLSLKEVHHRKYNRPDGCVKATAPDSTDEILVCDQSRDRSDGRWLVNPWLVDLAASSVAGYANAACGFTDEGTTILATNGQPFGDNTCVNGAVAVL